MKHLLEVKDVHKSFGGVKALDGCTISVRKGTITALIGPNGSGKTTLFDVISQLIDEDEGKIYFNGNNISDHTPFTAYKVAQAGISRTFQDVRLFKHLTIKDHLLLARSQENTYLLANLFKSVHDEQAQRDMQRVLDIVRLDKPLNTKAANLSYGQRKLLDLAIAIIRPHQLLMLDEPVAGVNPKIRELIKDILRHLVKHGETILLIEHDMNFTMELASYVYVLDAGKVISEGTGEKVRNDRKVLEAYLGS